MSNDNRSELRRKILLAAKKEQHSPLLVEQNYYATLVIEQIEKAGIGAAIRGGALLTNVYNEPYRISEDIDYAVSIEDVEGRGVRRRLMKPIKEKIGGIDWQLYGLEVFESLIGRDNSKIYNMKLQYVSVLDKETKLVKVDFAIMDKIVRGSVKKPIRTILDKIATQTQKEQVCVTCLTREEVYAEKIAAMLTRPYPAIRDFVDVYVGRKYIEKKIKEESFKELVRYKISRGRSSKINLTKERLKALEISNVENISKLDKRAELKNYNTQEVFNFATQLEKALVVRKRGVVR